jgi:hypothetical protein
MLKGPVIKKEAQSTNAPIAPLVGQPRAGGGGRRPVAGIIPLRQVGSDFFLRSSDALPSGPPRPEPAAPRGGTVSNSNGRKAEARESVRPRRGVSAGR